MNDPYGLARVWIEGDLVTRVVAVLLLAMSILSWTLMLTRARQQWRLRASARDAEAFWHQNSFGDGLALLAGRASAPVLHRLALEGQGAQHHHAQNRDDLHGQLSLSEWLTGRLNASIDEIASSLQSGLPVLASVGATAPFVGLLGTVWGIHHALVGIAASGQASIGQIAGPVGEALVMTAAGLFVAIPAVLGYNALGRANRRLLGTSRRFARQLHAYFLTGSPGPQHATVA